MNIININKLANKYEDFKLSLRKHTYFQLTDNRRIEIDFCKSVDEYNENVIRLVTTKNNITIIGTELVMRNFSTNGVIIYGKIKEINFDEVKANNEEI